MKSLNDILVLALANKACSAQLNKFISFIESGDELSAWQTVLGNLDWLRGNCLDIDQNYVESNANYIGKIWYEDGQLCTECTYKNGKRDGLYREWYMNGRLCTECTYKNGKRDGLYRRWYMNGRLCTECTYKDVQLDGLYRRWYKDGQLWIKQTYKDDILIK